jgi:hypothetical protein
MTTMTKTRTRAELLRAIQACQTTEEAHGLVNNGIQALRAAAPDLHEDRARAIVLREIGYTTTSCVNRQEAGRLLKLFGTTHPYFGAIEHWPATPEAIFQAGWEAGMQKLGGDGEGDEARS